MKFFIHSYPWLMKQQTWKCKVNVSCASSGIHLLSIFEILGQKLEVLLCIFRGIKILWNELTAPPPYPHHFALYAHWYINFLNSPIIQYFEISIPPLPSVTGGFKLWDCSFHWWARARERKTWFVDLTSRPLIHKGLFI